MKANVIKNFWYLTGISLLFIVIALLGFIGVESAYQTLDEEVNSAGAAILFLFPVYLLEGIAIAFIDVFVCQFTFITSIAIFMSALIARFLFSPENGHNIGYRILMGFGYLGALITAISCAIAMFCFSFPFGVVIAAAGVIFLYKLCSKGWKLTFNEITADKLSFYSDLPHNICKPAILCDTDFIVHTTNTSADRHYKTYNQPEMKGLLIYNFLTDETGAKLDRCAEMLKNNDSLERFILTYDENGNPDLTVTAVRQKNKKLVGYLFKHE